MSGSVQKPLVSVVMPVYNAEDHLDEALRCITQQEYADLEIICVDDGSTDSSPEILRRWRRKDSRICIITQDNQGAGVARNRGMEVVRGKYLLFLDADDVFRRQMIRELVATAEKTDTDIIVFRYYKFSGKKKRKTFFSAKDLGVPIGRVISPETISDRLYQADHGMPWNKFYRTDHVRKTGVRFQSLQNTNDEYFSRIVTAEAGKILFLNRVFVGYRVGNQNSLQGSVDGSILDFTRALAAIHDELKCRSLYDRYYITYQRFASIIIMLRLDAGVNYDAFRTLVNEISTDTLTRCEVDGAYVEERYRRVYRALQKKDISRVAFELYRVKNRKGSSVAQRIRRRLKQYLHI